MSGMLSQVVGLAGVRAGVTVRHRIVTRGGWIPDILPQGRVISGACSRDPSNTVDVTCLQAGLLMGKISTVVNSLGTVGFYAPSVLGVTSGALTGIGTSITLSVAAATELVRRCGSTGTFILTGPPAANGVLRSTTVTYSAVNLTTGVVTITAAGVNEVQTLGFTNSPSGTFQLAFVDLNGVTQNTGPITYSATAATLVSNINTALNTALGTSLVVASGTLVTAIALTFSGAGYLGLPQTLVSVDTGGLTAGNVSVTRTTAGSGGAFVAGSFVQPTDGSQTPLSFIPSGWPMPLLNNTGVAVDIEFPEIPIDCVVDSLMLLPVWPTDTSLQNYVMTSLSTLSGGKFIFSTQY